MDDFPDDGIVLDLEDFESDEISIRQRGEVLTVSAEVKQGRSNASESEGIVKHYNFPRGYKYGYSFENGELKVWIVK